MRVVLQRATRAQVIVDGEVVGRLPRPGLVALVGITHADTVETVEKMADKTWGLRILEAPPDGEPGRAECSASDLDAPILVISQFTLHADVWRGRRPSWSAAAPGAASEPLIDAYVQALLDRGAHVETGRFGAHMQVELVNDGPVTIILDSDRWN
jgi:D-aminoacyl-tRNA deacylase